MRSLRVSPGFRAFALDQLARVPNLLPRPMFGGIGLYSDGVFFGILAADVMYFKVDDQTRPDYEAAGMAPFAPFADRPTTMTMPYYSVPVHVLEDSDTLLGWARRAVVAAKRTQK